jgi:hypothetical protein
MGKMEWPARDAAVPKALFPRGRIPASRNEVIPMADPELASGLNTRPARRGKIPVGLDSVLTATVTAVYEEPDSRSAGPEAS